LTGAGGAVAALFAGAGLTGAFFAGTFFAGAVLFAAALVPVAFFGLVPNFSFVFGALVFAILPV